MPKVSDEHRSRRRDEILDAARRCFAHYGYEGATVARLEQETGLSRGAIFNYFASKQEIFLALAERDHERFGRLWLDQGFIGFLRAITAEEPDWLGVYFEAARLLRTDETFRERWKARAPELTAELATRMRRDQEEGQLRDDVSIETLGHFMGIVADGLALRVGTGFPTADLEELLSLVADATRARTGTPVRTGLGSRAPRRRSAASR